MKTMKYIYSLLVAFSLSALCFSCMEDEIVKSENNWCDGKTLVISMNAPANKNVSPMTRSSVADTTLSDVNILVYVDGTLLDEHVTYLEPNSPEVGKLQRGETVDRFLDLGKGVSGVVYAVANYGERIKGNGAFSSEASLKTMEFGQTTMSDGKSSKPAKLLMYAEGVSFNVGKSDSNNAELNLKRIYSMITVKLDRDLNEGVTVKPIRLALKHVPATGMFLPDNMIKSSDECVIDGDYLDGADVEDFLDKKHDSPEVQALYLYENRQPKGTNGGNQTTKTPKGLEPTDIVSVIKTNCTCSYIEIEADYTSPTKSGPVTYRFFLGKNATNDFDVERNVHYQLTLTLKGNGGIDEGTWRVETDFIGDVNIPDIYIGYRAGSTSEMVVTGDVGNLEGLPVLDNSDFSIGGPIGNGDKERGFTITANKTNVSDYNHVVGTATFKLKDGGGTKTAKIYQVPRLVDPIAIYKKAENADPSLITVRAYNPDAKSYETLISKGKWTATVKYSSNGQWYSIYNADKDGNAIESTKQGLGGTITGEGEVRFVYKPDSQNGKNGDETENVARHGMILVKYHNEWCEHEIYVRQGYGPVVMSGERFAWSAFNCQGLGGDGKPKIATSPTETGWLFNGGVNEAMHPFNPEYRIESKEIEYSDGTTGQFDKYKTDVTVWEDDYGSKTESSSSKGLQGPCPKGYIVPNAWTYREMTNSTEITTGYVYDDDYRGTMHKNPNGSVTYGWKWDGQEGAAVDDDNYCNPAKGTLFVKKDDKCTNLFFSYGKGVLKDIGKLDPKLVPEIGVGHRYANGALTYTDHTNGDTKDHAYGGYYWNATSFYRYGHNAGPEHMGKVDFGYNIFLREPNLIDVPGQDATIGGVPAVGIDGNSNASFVRCVRDLTPVINLTIPKGTLFERAGGACAGRITVSIVYPPTYLSLDRDGKVIKDTPCGEWREDVVVQFIYNSYRLNLSVEEVMRKINKNEKFTF